MSSANWLMLISLILIASLLSTGAVMLVSGVPDAAGLQVDVASEQDPASADDESVTQMPVGDLSFDDTLDLPSLPPMLQAMRPNSELPVHEAAGYDIGLEFEHRPPIA